MSQLGIMASDTSMSNAQSIAKWEQYRQGKTKSVRQKPIDTRAISYGADGEITSLHVSFMQADVQSKKRKPAIVHPILKTVGQTPPATNQMVFLPVYVHSITTELVAAHKMAISSTGAPRISNMFVHSTDNRFMMAVELVHATRLLCTIVEKALPTEVKSSSKMFITSVSINFSAELVYAEASAEGISNVFGLRFIAMRIANSLKDNLTNEVIVQRLQSAPKKTHELLHLMSRTDLFTDMHRIRHSQTPEHIQTRKQLYASLHI
ncbi:hypothetical protein T484DRAFT_3650094, partial [Baffinella frigidus]